MKFMFFIYSINSDDRTYELIMEKGGIISFEDGIPQIKRLFSIFSEDDYFGIHILQTLAIKSASSGGNGFKAKINAEGLGTWTQQRDDHVYYLRIQLHGANRDTWLDYIQNKFENRFQLEGDDTLLLYESEVDNGAELAFLHSIINLDIII